jgi:VWFA-related protein
VIGLLGALALGAVQAAPVFPTSVELVYVDVFVTKKNAPVAGLASADFRLQDNGVAQLVEVVDRAVVPTTAVLVLDASASVEGGALVHLKSAARRLLSALGGPDEAALVTFNEKVLLRQDATRDARAVSAALDSVRPRGGTALIDALFVSLKKRWGTGRPVIVLFTDGRDSASWLENEDVVEAARESSALLHVVGTEPEWQTEPTPDLPTGHASGSKRREYRSGYVNLLLRAAEITGGAYWPVGSTAELPATFERIIEAAAARYVLRYEPTGVPRAGRHRLKVSVRRGGLDVRARQEYVVAGTGTP